MNKTTTRISYCLGILLILLNYSAYAQHVDGSSQSNPIIVPQSLATAYFSTRTDIVAVQYAYAVNGGASLILPPFIERKTDTELDFNLTSLNYSSYRGKVVEIQRQVLLANGTIDDDDKNYYVYPFNPSVSLSVCSGKIKAKDLSGNDAGLMRRYELRQNGNLLESPNSASDTLQFLSDVQPGVTYTVKIIIFSTGGRPGSNGTVYEGIQSITIPAAPTLTTNFSTTCAGKEVQLSATGGGSYQWSTGNQTSAQVSVYPSTTTTYSVSVTQSVGCAAIVRYITINIHPNPAVSIDPSSPICVGSTVQLRARGSGGTPGYVYNWSRDDGDQSTFVGSTSGEIVSVQPSVSTGYRVTITDGNGCESTAQVQVVVNPNPTASIDPIPPLVNAGSNVTLTGRVSGGTSPYQYSWSNNATTSSITITASTTTTYRVTVSDNKSCTSVAEVLVTVSTQPTVTIAPVAQPICAGVATVLQSSVSGGTSPYTYLWSNGATTSTTTVSPSVTSTYGLTVTDQQGKKDSTQVQVLVNPKPVPSIQGTQPNCVGQATVLTASGGSTYLWTGGATTASITVNPAQSTTYHVTVSNTYNCSAVDSFGVIVPAALQLGYTLQNDQDCTPNNVTVVPSPLNAQAPLSYSMQRNGSTTLNPSLSNLTTDTFTLIVTDSNGCTASTLVSINEIAPLRITLSKESEHDCTPGNTRINMSTTGARGALSYRLDGGEPYTFTTYLNVPNGLHTVSVQDAFGCVASDTVRIAEDSLLVVADPLISHVTCPGGSDGSISLPVRGGTGTYYFNWSNLGSSTHVLSNIPEGSYAVTVVDSRNCQVTKTINVNEPGDIGFGAQRIVKHVTCNGGSDGSLEVTTPFSGGTAPYKFLWSNGDTTNIASNLSVGQYGITITDAKGCQTAFWSTGISEPAPININSTGQYTNHLDCIANNVSITVAATGGRGGYTYSLNGGAPQNSGIFTGQSNGTHQLEVKDSANCSQTFTIQVVEHVPFTLGYQLENDQDCTPYNTSIVPLPQNAQGTVSYWLFRGSTININPSLSGLSTGAYTLSGTDSKGCSASVSITINEKIPPLPIYLDTLTVCAGVPATMSVQGAPTSGVSYVWTVPAGANNPGNVASFSTTIAGVYSVVMTDTTTGCSSSAQGEVRHTPGPDPDLCCSESICAGQSTYLSSNNYTPLSFAWSTGASTRGINVNPVQNTTYTLTVTDAAGCKGTAQVSVQVLPKPSVQIDSVPPICSGDTITLRAVVSSGTAPYVYYWGSGSSSSSFKVSPSSTSTYTVSITDVNGCMASAQVLVPVRTRPSVELGADQIVCTGTNATLRAEVLNGTAPFTYAWSNGATQSQINVVPGTTTTYSVTVSDAIGCKSSDQVTVQVNPRPGLGFGSDTTICAGSSATLSANIIGGTAPFTYNWSNGSSASTLTVNPTSTSTYTLTVTDQKGCLAIGSTTVNVLSRPSVSVGPDRAICIGSSATLNATATSAHPPLTYAWSTGASTSNLSISPMTTTTYTITVTDSLTCSHSDTIMVVVNTTTAGISGNSSACVGQNTTLTATGGGTYLWSTGASTASIVVSPSTTTTYSVTVTNQGCLDTATQVLNVSTTNLSLIAPNILNTTDCQTGNIAYEVKYTGSSTPGLEFRMNGGAWQSSPWFTNRSAGTYLIEGQVVTPTCILSLNSRSGSVSEVSGATVIASISLANENDCTTGNTAITVNLTQSVLADYRLYPSPNWNTSKTFTNRSSGKYIVEVRPRNSSVCMERDTIEFDEKTASITSVNITGHDDCIQGNLRIEVVATGTPQSGPFQYRLKNYNGTLTSPWQDSPIFISPANASAYDRVELKTGTGCIYTQTLGYGLSEIDPLSLSITGLTYVSGATDCIKGNTRVNITTSTGEGVSVSQWRINGGAWTWSPEFYGLGRDTIFVEVLAYDDVRSCVVGKKLLVNERSIPEITQLVLSQQEDCVLGNAQISTQKTGGEGTISYKLNTGTFVSNPVFSNLGSGNYLVTVRDGNTCQDTLSVRITEPALLATTTSKANESDCTGGNARITVSATGARGALSFSLNGGTPQASNIFNNLSNGTYTVTAQDGVGCTASKTVTVTESGALIASPVKTGETDCVQNNTSVAINVTGALSTLSYRLNGGTAQASNVFTNLSNGSHTISVQDAGGCSTSTTVTVNEATPMALGTPQIQAVKCYGEASGSIGLNISGGVTPYTITWNTGAQGAFIQHLPAGTYAFTVTDSRGCTLTGAALVPEPPAFNAQLSNFVDVACHNGTTGAISTTITGGLSPYSYRWSNNASTSTIANIAAGNYGLTVTDANGCVATATGSLANPAPLSLSHQVANDQDCIANNLSITALASGGRGNYAFSLNGATPQAEGLFTGKTTGTYTLTLQDGAGCSAEPLVLGLINETLPPPPISIDTVRECVGVSASLSINGAPSTGMQYNWTLPNGANNPGNVAQFSTLIAGTYSVVMTDTATGCTRTASGVVVHKALPNAEICCRDTICSGQSATLSSNAGYATYAWSNGATTSSQTVSPASTTTYTLTITGSNGCSATDQEVIVVNANPVANTGTDQIICSGDSLLLTGSASGGAAPYTYSWSSGATSSNLQVSPLVTTTYTLTVTDSHSCQASDQVVVIVNPVPDLNTGSDRSICAGDSTTLIGAASGGNAPYLYAWSTGATSSSIQVSPVISTTYTLTITDSLGCQAISMVVVQVNPRPIVNTGMDRAICTGDSTMLEGSVSGGTGPYNYTWSNGANTPNTTVRPDLDTLYSLSVMDSLGCKDTALVNVQVLPLPSVNIVGKDSLCFGSKETLQVQVSGGLQPYSFTWNTGATSDTLVMDTTLSTIYTLEVRDSNTCVTKDTFALTINPLPSITVKASDTLRCDNPQVLLQPLTASSDLQFQWKTSAGHTLADSSQVWVDSMDTYIVEVVDSVGCSSSDSTRVITYIPQIVQIDSLPSTHCDSANAQIHIHLSNPGAWLYRIDSTQWDTSATFSGLLMGTYAISIASPDTNCIIDTSITIGSREICIEICAGDSILIGKPGLNPWCMKWLPEDGLSNPDSSYTWVKPTNSTIYRLIITDDEGNIVDSLIYKVTLCPQLSISMDTLNLCDADSAMVTVNGGVGPYVWKNQSGTIVAQGTVFTPTQPGTYTVSQLNTGGAPAFPATIQVIQEIGGHTLDIHTSYAAICEDSLLLTAEGNFHALQWKNGLGVLIGGGQEIFIGQADTYTLIGEIGMGCQAQTSVTITSAPFNFSLTKSIDTVDLLSYKIPQNFHYTFSGTGNETLTLLTPEGKTVTVELDKGCFDCGVITIEVRDTLLPDSTHCEKTVRRSWIARNECGRKAIAVQTIQVKDFIAPSFIDFPLDSMVVTCGDSLPDERPKIVDNYDEHPKLSVVQTDSIARGTCTWLLVRVWEARDTCGNFTRKNQYILVRPPAPLLPKAPNPYACGDNFTPPGIPNENLIQTLRAQDDFIYLYGFPIQVTSVIGTSGTFSGRGLMTVPFGATPILVDFHNAQINVDYRILAGSVTAVRDTAFKLPKCEVADKEFCLPTANNTGENQAELGFKNCEYTKNPPYPGYQVGMPFDNKYDPWGFDCNGTHRETGTKTNPQGCTQEQVHDPNDKHCDSLANSVYTWVKKDTITKEGVALANQVADSIRIQAEVIIAELINKVTVDLAAKIVACNALRGEMRSLVAGLALGEDSTFVVGSGGKYIKEGMWKSFLDKPQKLNLSLDRNASVVSLENKHVDLYTCDQEQEFQKLLLATLKALATEKGLGELVKQLITKIQRMPADSVVKYTNSAYLLAWVKTQINAEANHQAQTKLEAAKQAAQPVGFYSKAATDRTKPVLASSAKITDQMINAALNHFGEKLATERLSRFKKEFNHGETMIGNTHRAYFLEAILQERSLRAALLPPGQADSSEAMLPIRVKNNVEGFDYEIIIDNLTFSPQTGGKLDAFLLLDIPGSSERIVLEGKDIYFSPGGVDFTQNRLELKCDVAVRFMNVAQLKFKGGQTWAKWNCNGFEVMNLAAEIQFCRDVLIPLEEGTLEPVVPDSVLLTATFGTAITSWDNFNLNMSFSHPFAIAGMEDFKWKIEGAHLDLSQTRTDADILFPNGYDFKTVSQRASWKGFYMEEFTMYLPKKLSKEGQRTAVSSGQGNFGITARDLIIDDGGVSVNLGIPQRILELNDGNLDGWSFSIDSLTIGITKNRFSKAGFGGLVHVPLFGDATPENSFRYTAAIGLNNLYSFTVQPGASKHVPMWLANVNLDKSSAITVSSQNGKFTAQAVFNGDITLDGAIGKFAVNTPKMGFKGLKVSNQKPYFDPGVWAAPDSIGAKLGGFDIRIEKLQTVDISEEEKGLRVNIGIKLSPGDGLNLAASGGFLLKGRLDVSSGRQRWLPTGAKLEDFFISGDIKDQLSLSGRMIARDNDPRYGKVFQASLSVKFKCVGPSSIQVDAMGLFGEKDDSKYFMVDVLAQFPGVGGPIQLRGIGGGAYYHMSRADTLVDLSKLATDTSSTAAIALDTLSDLGKSLSGVTYVPNPGIALGIKLAAVLALPEEKAFNANVAIIVQFKTGGGVDEIAFQGIGQFFAPLNFKLKPVKIFGPPPAGTFGTDPPKMSCNVDLRYNFSQKTFHGKLQVFINADSAVIGEGTAEILVAPKKWYIYLGTPQVPIRVRLIVGKTVLAETRAYFDFGNELPPLPDLPSQFRGDAGGSGLFSSALRSRAGGGIIMGFSFFQDLGLKEGSKSPVYAYFTIDLGADMGLVDFGDTYCGNTGKKIGINGWYAYGQAWVYVGAKVGLKIGQKRFDIASLGASAVLQIKAPNPVFGQGAIGGRFSVMGGLVKGKFNLRFKFGSECDVEEEGDEESLDQNIRIIAALRPSKDQKNVSPEQLPSADFLMEMDGLTELPGENGEVLSYRVVLEQASLSTNTGTAVNGRILFAADRRSLRFQPFDLMPANTDLVFLVKVRYFRNGVFAGTEEAQTTFRTSALPNLINPANISASYPINGMEHLYKDEYGGTGEFIELQQGQAYLFDNVEIGADLYDSGGAQIASVPVQYDEGSKRLLFDLPNDALANGACYTVYIRKKAAQSFNNDNGGTNGSSTDGTLCQLQFCTSQYSTFSQKVSAFFGNASVQTTGYTLKIASSVEAFDGKETQWLHLSTFIESDSWFQQHIQKMYQAQQTGGQAALNTAFQFAPTLRNADWGLIPQGAISLDTGRTILYSVYQAIATDILDLNQQAKDWNERYTTNCMNAQTSGSVCNNCCPTPAIVTEFMTKTMPAPPLDRYAVILRYVIPGMPGVLSASYSPLE